MNLEKSFFLSKIGVTVVGKERWLIAKAQMQFAYGSREIFLKYMNLDFTHIFPGVLQHGLGPSEFLTSNWPAPRVGLTTRMPVWLYSEKATEFAKKSGVKNVQATGAPWLYLDKGLNEIRMETKKKIQESVVVFPRHYSHEVVKNESLNSISSRIEHWKSIIPNKKIVICLYWTEFLNLNWHFAAKRENIDLTCAGISMTDPYWSLTEARVNFLPKLRSIINTADHCIFEDYTSAIFYAVSLGKMCGMFVDPDCDNYSVTTQERISWVKKNMPEMVGKFDNTINMKNLAADFMGSENFRSPSELESIFTPIPKAISGPQFYGEFE